MIKFKEEIGTEWSYIKTAITKKAKEMDPKILTNILVLTTATKNAISDDPDSKGLFEEIEAELILKLKEMNFSDLVNLMWSA